MTRSITLALLFASLAYSEPYVITGGIGTNNSVGSDFDKTWMFKVCTGDSDVCSAPISFQRTWADRGTTLAIERSELTSYGWTENDIADFESFIGDRFNTSVRGGFNHFGHVGLLQHPLAATNVIDFSVDRFEWTFDASFSSIHMGWKIYGDGTIVPEPVVSALLISSLLGCGNFRQRRCRSSV